MKKFLMVWVLVLCGGVFACSAEDARERTSLVREASYEDDEDNCGAEGYVCAAGRECIDYKCTPAWLEIEDMGAPDERHSAAAGMLGGKFVVFGGCSTTSGDYPALSSSGVYDPAMDSWASGPTLNDARCAHAAASTSWGIYTFGGLTSCENGTALGPSLEGVFSSPDGWSVLSAPNTPPVRFNSAMVWTGNSLFLFGGANAMGGTTTSASLLQLGAPWLSAPCTIGGCARGGNYVVFEYDGLIYTFNGDSGLVYDPSEDAWDTASEPMSGPDYEYDLGPASSQTDDGSRVYRMSHSGSIWIYDKALEEWAEDTASQPMGLCFRGAAAWVDSEYIIWSGNCGGLSSVGGRYQPPAPGVLP